MSARPGYEELLAQRGRKVADQIIDDAERYSDGAHQPWAVALRWSIDQHDRPPDPDLEAQQRENVRLCDDLAARRGDDSRPILYLATELGGDAFEHPARLVRAETVFDTEGWRLAPEARMSDQLAWAASQALALALINNAAEAVEPPAP